MPSPHLPLRPRDRPPDVGTGVESGRGTLRANARASVVLGICLLVVPSTLARGSPDSATTHRAVVQVRSILTSEFGFARPAGLTYVGSKNLLFVAQSRPTGTRLLRLTPFEKERGVLTLPKLARTSTLAFDPNRARVIAISAKELTTVRSSSLAAGSSGIEQLDIRSLRLRRPQAATFDPRNQSLLILDSEAREIVRVPSRGGRGAPTRLSLRGLGARTFRGLAYNRADRLIYVTSPDRGLLYGLDGAGKVRRTFDLRGAALAHVTGIVFAPSTDPTDAPGIQNLFVADTGDAKARGRVVEFSLAPSVSLPVTVTAQLARTIPTSRFAPASPDPSGITYIAANDVLVFADSEVEELPIYREANLFFMTRSGVLVSKGTTAAFSREPTGVTFDPRTATLYVSDDDKRAVFSVRPGPDGRHGTGDDLVSRLNTTPFGNLDPEDVQFVPTSGHLFVAGGVGAEIYDVDPVNAVFGDSDDVVTHFDVAIYGIRNVEGLGYDPQRRTLLAVADVEHKILELTRGGRLVRVIDLATIPGIRWPAGVTAAPTSNPDDSPNALSYWITDREVDNDEEPTENDGRIFEVAVP
jgi:SdiA-regulated